MTTITALPDPPLRSSPTDFAAKGDAFMAALPDFVTETNTVASEINTSATNAANSATSAANSATSAANSATSAASSAVLAATSANYQGEWSAGTYNLSDLVSYNGGVWLCAVATTTGEPSISSDWISFAPNSSSIGSSTLHFLTNR